MCGALTGGNEVKTGASSDTDKFGQFLRFRQSSFSFLNSKRCDPARRQLLRLLSVPRQTQTLLKSKPFSLLQIIFHLYLKINRIHIPVHDYLNDQAGPLKVTTKIELCLSLHISD